MGRHSAFFTTGQVDASVGRCQGVLLLRLETMPSSPAGSLPRTAICLTEGRL